MTDVIVVRPTCDNSPKTLWQVYNVHINHIRQLQKDALGEWPGIKRQAACKRSNLNRFEIRFLAWWTPLCSWTKSRDQSALYVRLEVEFLSKVHTLVLPVNVLRLPMQPYLVLWMVSLLMHKARNEWDFCWWGSTLRPRQNLAKCTCSTTANEWLEIANVTLILNLHGKAFRERRSMRSICTWKTVMNECLMWE